MNPKIVIRSETDADVIAITELTVAAFKTLEISNHTEQFIIEALRNAHALTVSLVAEMNGHVTGHIAFSPVTISDGTQNWYGLGPVSVLPTYQRQGIGKALIQEGLSRLKDMNAQGCCLVGHPDYYRKFGFNALSVILLAQIIFRIPAGISVQNMIPILAPLLMSILYLISIYFKRRHPNIRYMVLPGAIYNTGFAVFFLWHALKMNVAGSHPVAFAIVEQTFSFLFGILAAANSWVLWSKSTKNTS